MDQIKCIPLVATTDGPLFHAKPGTLSELVNMTLQPGGFAEARGGVSELIPSGGTGATFLSAGGYSAIHQLSTSGGWIRTYNSAAGAGSQYSANRQLHAGGWAPFPTCVATDAVYFGADAPFQRICANIVYPFSGATFVVAYEYYNGSAWTALTTSETITWTSSLSTQYASWTLPTNWAANTIGDAGTGNVLKYWMRIIVSSVTGLTGIPRISYAFGFWAGVRDLYAWTANPLGGAAVGTLVRYGQSGTTAEAFAISSALHSGLSTPTRAASYRGRTFFVNGIDSKRWDGYVLADIGLPEGSWTIALGSSALAGALAAGTYRYYVAWGYGPMTVVPIVGTALDLGPMYGYGRAHYAGEITIAVASTIGLTFTGTTVPDGVSCIAVYRTQDLTAITTSNKRANVPALLVTAFYRLNDSSTFATAFNSGTLQDDGLDTLYPPIEMYNYDVAPPSGAKFIIVYQNRLLLGTDDTWYWSDPFVPDRFRKYVSYISLAKSTGGRHMGGAEYGDQAVLFTEDQTWGLTNVDLDVPNLYPIHPGVGCIAPDSVATGDGVIVWAARDGIYFWDGGSRPPQKASWDWEETFGKMSYETHGGSRAVIHNYHYDIRLASPGYGTTQGCFRLNLLTGQWSTITSAAAITDTLYPFGPIHGPLGSEDPGGLHPVYAHGAYSGANSFKFYLGEMTTRDAGTAYTCSGTMHFPLPPGGTLIPERVLAYYSADTGWGTPSFVFTPGTSIIGDPVGTLTTGTPDTGADYSMVRGTFSQNAAGTSDLQVKFTVSSASGGTVGHQRLYGAVLEGRKSRIRMAG